MLTLRVAQMVPETEAEGPGRRFAVWVMGCPLRCPGCCNPEMFPDLGGVDMDVDALAREVLAAPRVEGLTLLGGEPFAQAAAGARLARAVHDGGKSVMVFSGYTLAELRAQDDPGVAALLAACDLLVDGRFERDQPEIRRRWIGSRNQVMHFFTDRYAPGPQFAAPNTVELRLTGGALTVNGWPAAARGVLR